MTYCQNFSLFKYKTCKNTIKNSEHCVIQRVLNVSTFQEMLHFVSFSVWWLILYYGTWVGKSVLGGVISEGECPSQLHTQNKTSNFYHAMVWSFKILRDLLCCNNFSSPILEVQITYPSLRDTFSYLPRVLLHQRFS